MAIGDDCRRNCESGLLKALEMESVDKVRRKICDSVAELSNYISMHGSE